MNNQPPAKWTLIQTGRYYLYYERELELIKIPKPLFDQLQSEAIKKWLEESGTQELLFKQNKQARTDERKKILEILEPVYHDLMNDDDIISDKSCGALFELTELLRKLEQPVESKEDKR